MSHPAFLTDLRVCLLLHALVVQDARTVVLNSNAVIRERNKLWHDLGKSAFFCLVVVALFCLFFPPPRGGDDGGLLILLSPPCIPYTPQEGAGNLPPSSLPATSHSASYCLEMRMK